MLRTIHKGGELQALMTLGGGVLVATGILAIIQIGRLTLPEVVALCASAVALVGGITKIGSP